MTPEEMFVGGVSVAIGVIAVIISIGNWDRCYRLSKVRWIEPIGGRTAARWTYAIGGVLLIMLGVAIAAGFGPEKKGTFCFSRIGGSSGDSNCAKNRMSPFCSAEPKRARLFSQPGAVWFRGTARLKRRLLSRHRVVRSLHGLCRCGDVPIGLLAELV